MSSGKITKVESFQEGIMGGRDEIAEDKNEVYDQIASLDTEKFMDFSQRFLRIPISVTLQYYRNGDIEDGERYSQLQRGYKQDPEKFLQTFRHDFRDILTGMDRHRPVKPPDELPPREVYHFLRKHKNNWLKFLRQEIGLQITAEEEQCCKRNLQQKQKIHLLEHWESKQDGACSNVSEKLRELLEQFKQPGQIEEKLPECPRKPSVLPANIAQTAF